jgi:hypothetical protein
MRWQRNIGWRINEVASTKATRTKCYFRFSYFALFSFLLTMNRLDSNAHYWKMKSKIEKVQLLLFIADLVPSGQDIVSAREAFSIIVLLLWDAVHAQQCTSAVFQLLYDALEHGLRSWAEVKECLISNARTALVGIDLEPLFILEDHTKQLVALYERLEPAEMTWRTLYLLGTLEQRKRMFKSRIDTETIKCALLGKPETLNNLISRDCNAAFVYWAMIANQSVDSQHQALHAHAIPYEAFRNQARSALSNHEPILDLVEKQQYDQLVPLVPSREFPWMLHLLRCLIEANRGFTRTFCPRVAWLTALDRTDWLTAYLSIGLACNRVVCETVLHAYLQLA